MTLPLLFSVFVIATCGLVYELVSGTLASYLLGDTVMQFSTVIGVYLSAMGVGSYLSKYARGNLVRLFIQVELLIGAVGGSSAAILFNLFDRVASFRLPLYSMVFVIGVLVGFEIPLLMRILKDRLEFKDLVSRIFAFDYVGALIASILFPILLVPHLGLVRTGFFFGILNVAVGLWTLSICRREIPGVRHLALIGGAVLVLLTSGFCLSEKITSLAEEGMYQDHVVYAKSTPYQRVVVTKSGDDLRLYLNGHLQFSSRDEYRYHEPLIHVGMAALKRPERVLMLGGGDGLGTREILKYPSVRSVTLVDIDPEVTRLFSTHPLLRELNHDAFRDPRVKVVNVDAFQWLRETKETFDFVVIDFPDPSNFSIGKLYSTAFFGVLSRVVARDGAAVLQSASPYFARRSFWCIVRTLEAVGLTTTPYHNYVPSFGEWGFVLATHAPFDAPEKFLPGLRFLSGPTLAQMLQFPPDMDRVPAEVNRLNNQALVRYYESEWSKVAPN